jgi:hypothetical protein
VKPTICPAKFWELSSTRLALVPPALAKSVVAAFAAAICPVAPLVMVPESVGGSTTSVPAPPLMLVKVQAVPV